MTPARRNAAAKVKDAQDALQFVIKELEKDETTYGVLMRIVLKDAVAYLEKIVGKLI